jgi:hypothetical protein
MARILTDRPSSGKSVLLFIPVASNSGFVSTAYTTLIEAPDFSVPDEGDPGSVVDPGDSSRVLAPGEVAFRAPLAVTNTTSTTRWVQLQVLLESGDAIPLTNQVPVPAQETLYLPIQGQRLVKYNFAAANGGRLQVRAEVGDAVKVDGVASEGGAADHAPDSEAGS